MTAQPKHPPAFPRRIQRKRTKGWRMPEGAVYVGRPTVWGNPFALDDRWLVWAAVALGFLGNVDGRRQASVALYRWWLTGARPKARKIRGNMGAIGYEDGREVPTQDLVQGLAGVMACSYRAPQLPPRPALAPLRGHDLACFCAQDRPCHADVLLELANREPPR